MIPWARSFLAAQVLGARSLPPAFGLNKRQYWRHFGTPRYDWLLHRAAEWTFPVFRFAEEDYDRYGQLDVVSALRMFASDHDLWTLKRYVLTTEGIWGGFEHISAARDFVRATLYRTRYAPRNLLMLRERILPGKLLITMHVRLGDFLDDAPDEAAYRGAFNRSLPLQWYMAVAESLLTQLGDSVQFLVVSDGNRCQLEPLLDRLPGDTVDTLDTTDADCSDLLALASADLLVCSVSSYSLWAAFLSDGPYVWFGPQLHLHDENLASIWGHEPKQERIGSPTHAALLRQRKRVTHRQGRGIPVPLSGQVPQSAIAHVRRQAAYRDASVDLVRYGVVPIGKPRN